MLPAPEGAEGAVDATELAKQAEDPCPLLPRQFLPCDGAADGQKVRVMQFNVLADGMGQGQFKGRVSEDVLAHTYRLALSIQEVRRVSPDVLCMQEVNHYGAWEEELGRLGYDGTFVPKYDDSYPEEHQSPPDYYQGTPTDGCAIFVRRDRWRVSSHRRQRFAELTEDRSSSQVLLLAALESCEAPQRTLIVSCSHLKSGPSAASSALRKSQCKAWSAAVREFCSVAGESPVILSGDMNEIMLEAPDGGVAELCKELGLRSAYAIGQGSDPAFTCIDGAWRGCLDYILISPGLQPSALLQIPELPEGALPSAQYPSDHLALAADLHFAQA